MRSVSIIGAVLALASTTFAQDNEMTSMSVSMVPMATPSAPPVTMAWNDEPTENSKESNASNSVSETPAASGSMSMGMGMGMGGSMTMSDGTVMATGAMDMAGATNFTGSAVGKGAWGGVVLGAFGVGVGVVAGML